MALYLDETEDGQERINGKCYSCEQKFSQNRLASVPELAEQFGIKRIDSTGGGVSDPVKYKKKKRRPNITLDEIDYLKDLTESTHQKFRGIEDKYHNLYGIRSQYDNDGKMIARLYPNTLRDSISEEITPSSYKKRTLPKDFSAGLTGYNGNENMLFGACRFQNGGKYLLIVGGEEDCPAAYKMLREDQEGRGKADLPPVAVVAPSVGETGCKEQIKNNYWYLDQFDVIVLCLDNDEKGREAVDRLLPHMPREKVRVMECPIKDPCEALKAGKQKQFVNNFYRAKEKLATGVTGSGDIRNKMIQELSAERLPLPPFMSEAQEMMGGGIPLGRIINIAALSGIGKCLGKDTPVLMYNGDTKKVQDIAEGELLMGPDGTPRTVLSTTTGREEMFRVDQVKGSSYEVNRSHILSLRWSSDYGIHRKGEVLNISVNDYLDLPKSKKSFLKGYIGDCINLGKGSEVWEPYILGLWLADGSSKKAEITFNKQDKELIDLFNTWCEIEGYEKTLYPSNDREGCVTLGAKGGFHSKLKELGVFGNKHIPKDFLLSSYQDRLDLLAGIIDGDGHYISGCYDLTLKNTKLVDNVVFLARSVGLRVTVTDKFSKCEGFEGDIYKRITISGDLDKIPCSCPRKVASPRSQIKNHKHTGVSLTSLGEGDYYGFEIDGDKLFMLGDFTVTHNTTIVNEIIYDWIFNSPYTPAIMSMELDDGEFGTAMLSRHTGVKIDLMHSAEERLAYINSQEVMDAQDNLMYNEDGGHRFMMVEAEFGKIKVTQDRILTLIIQHGVKVLVVDPLSDLLDGMSPDEQAVFMGWQKFVVKKYKVIFVNILHVRKGGQGNSGEDRILTEDDIQGSSAIYKSGALNMLVARNKLAEDETVRNTIYAIIAKCRWTGNTGAAGQWYYDRDSHSLHDKKTYFEQMGKVVEDVQVDEDVEKLTYEMAKE